MSPRLPPIPPREWPPALLEAGAALRPPPDHPSAGKLGERPPALAPMAAFAHHPDLVRTWFPFNGHVLYGTTLTPRLRQFLIMRVASRRRCDYLWSQQVVTAGEVGLDDTDIAGVARGPEAPGLSRLEAAAVRAADEMIDDGVISDPTWNALAADLTPAQLLDVVFTVGCYEAITFFMNSVALEPESAVDRPLPGDATT